MALNFVRTASQWTTKQFLNLGVDGGAITMELWVKLANNPGGGNNFVFAYQCGATTDVEYYIYYTGNATPANSVLHWVRTRLGVADNEVNETVDLGTAWHHLAITYDATNVAGYRDGVLKGTTAASGNGTNNIGINECTVGRFERAGSEGDYYNGDADEMRVWNAAKTIDEINANMYRRIPVAGGLLGYYRYDEGGDIYGTDYTQNGTAMTHLNGASYTDAAPISCAA